MENIKSNENRFSNSDDTNLQSIKNHRRSNPRLVGL